MSAKKSEVARAHGQPAGDCVDCNQCVAVCPTGIDIRNGLQIDCIQCGLCIDACDNVMEKIGRPKGLIAYDTDINIHNREHGKPETYKIVRSRTLLYVGIIAIVALTMLYALVTRHDMAVKAIHDRNPIAVQLKDGSIRNGFAIHLTNKLHETRQYVLSVEGIKDPVIEVVGGSATSGGLPQIEMGPDQTHDLRVLVSTKQEMERGGSLPMTFVITDAKTGAKASTSDHFRAP